MHYSIAFTNWDERLEHVNELEERLEEMDNALSDLERVLTTFKYEGPYNHPLLRRT
jgi:hypothetical protein